MRASAVLAAIYTVSCVTVVRRYPNIQTNILEESPPLFIPCNLTDIVTISAPVQFSNDTVYYLYSPNNAVTKLNIAVPVKQKNESTLIHERTKQYPENVNNSFIILDASTVKIKNVNTATKDVFVEESNEFAIGPVGLDDHGNWVLSAYYKVNGSWAERFQVITIQITEYVPVWSSSKSLHIGGSMELGFAYPLPDIETCELLVPMPAADQPFGSYFRDYSRSSLASCRYLIPSLTRQDAGRWTIIGVGKIVYKGRVTVKLNDTAFTNSSLNTSISPFSYKANALSSSESNKFLKLLLLPMLGQILKMYYKY